jgi:diaminopimelate decarboxylase
MIHKPDRLPLFPDMTTIQDDSLNIGGQDLAVLADRYGTPLYIYDRATMDGAAAKYKAALKAHYPAEASVTYAGKAFLCKAVAEWVGQQGFLVDCTGEGEIEVALSGRLPKAGILAHGVNKSQADLEAAIRNAGTIVIDNLSELRRLVDLPRKLRPGGSAGTGPSIWLRLQPGEVVQTHHPHTQTGQTDSKFGMTSSEIHEAARFANSAGIPVNGIHFHLGSNFREATPLVRAAGFGMQLAKEIGMPETWHFCPGGGWSVAYHEDELPQPDIDEYVRVIAHEVLKRCRLNGLSLPTLHLEPGRSLIARAGVALYRVGAVKRRKQRTWLLVDGGMADNPRYALYRARYSCLPVKGLRRAMTETVSIAGPYCESGDVLIEDLLLPRIEEGEVLAIPVSGAYQLSMSSNYNGARRPAGVWLEQGKNCLIIRRESIGDLTHRQLSIS